jgi:hypothetical protein
MRDRLVTLACALGALALFILLFVGPGEGLGRRGNVARPTSEETRGNGYRAALTWLAASHLRTVSQRERFDALLARDNLATTGNVLIVTLPGTDVFRLAETRALQKWVRAGNTLLILAALADAPDWATVMGGVGVGDLKGLSGLDFDRGEGGAHRATPAVILVPNRPHAYFNGVRQALGAAPHSGEEWTARLPSESFMLALAHERDGGKAALWTRLEGDGRIVVCGLGSLFTDNALGLADNAQLLANIIGANLGRSGAVVFDDYHQGLSAAYDPQKFYSDPRLYLTCTILIALWFVWVLGATRLRVPSITIAAPREADLVRANGAFLARVLPTAAAARRLFEDFFRRVALRMPQSAAQLGTWEYLHASTHVSASELAQLRHWHTRALSGARVPLVRLYNLIWRISRQIA